MVVLLLAPLMNIHPVYASESQESTYQAFWDILNREAELVVKVYHGNETAAKELLENSREGEENAAQISALIWESLKELKASGVKLYYTQDELREMARDIKRNGLPNETVEMLKAQNWSEEDIQALQRYIAAHADEISGDFNMSEFLKNFSTAFIRVGFKYAHYETWAFEKWQWKNTPQFRGKLPENVTINPLLIDEWIEFYRAYNGRNITKMTALIDNITNTMYDFFTFTPDKKSNFKVTVGNFPTGNLGNLSNKSTLINGTITLNQGVLRNVYRFKDGFVLINVTEKEYDAKTGGYMEIGMAIYWPTALKAYNLTRQVYVILRAMEQGNDNPETWWILNQKVGELKSALKVYKSEVVRRAPSKPIPSPPIIIGPPTPQPPSKTFLSFTRKPEKREIHLTESDIEALNPNDEGHLEATVEVETVDVTDSYATYRVRVLMEASDNVVTDVSISVSGTELTDQGSIDMIHPDDGQVEWDSQVSDHVEGSGSVTVSGTVEITYVPNKGPMPKSGDDRKFEEEKREITLSYSATITLRNDGVDPSKVTVRVEPSENPAKVGDRVNFTIVVCNDNPVDVEGTYTLTVTVPEDDGSTTTVELSDVVYAPKESCGSSTTSSVVYSAKGEYGYHLVFSFGQYSKSASGSLIVINGESHGPSLRIVGSPSFEPSYPKEGDLVNFTVWVKNEYESDKSVEIDLFIDGVFVDQTSGSVGAGSEESFTLHWSAQAGEHEYTVKLYRLVNGQKQWADLWSGKIRVRRPDQQFAVELEAFPRELEGGGMVFFTVGAWNFAGDALNVQFHVVDESGRVVYPRDGGWISKYLPKGASNYTLASFDLNVHGVGSYTYTVIARISGEEEKDTATITIKPANGTELKQVGFECDDLYFNWNRGAYTATLVCKAFIYNPSQNTVEISSVSVDNWLVDNQDLKDTLEHAWVVKYPKAINASKIEVLTFENTAHAGLGTLEHNLFGANVLVVLKYTISPGKGHDIKFIGTEIINIKQDNSDVIVDIGVNVGVAIVIGELVELPIVAELAWDIIIGPLVIGKIKNELLG